MRKKRHLKKWVKLVITLIVLSVIGLIAYKYYPQEKEVKEDKKPEKKIIKTTTKKEDTNNLSLVMVGDCLIHRFVYTDALESDGNYHFDKMFTEVSDLIKNHDLAYYNQESNIGGKSLGLSAYPRFNSPEEIGDTMVNLGFNLVSLANNHTKEKKV